MNTPNSPIAWAENQTFSSQKSITTLRREAGQTNWSPVGVLALARCGYQGNENSKSPLSASEFPPRRRRRDEYGRHSRVTSGVNTGTENAF